MNYNIKKILLDLISIQSDTGTYKECNIEKYIFDTLKSSPYFKKNTDLLGLYGENDILNRHVVWALKDNYVKDTIILISHYDAAPIDNYGPLAKYALNPEMLRKELKNIDLDDLAKEDLQNDDWLWGRGSCDMKAGIAINLNTILTNKSKKNNILFLSVSDEENISYGMRSATNLLYDLKEKYNLNYKLLILTEPHQRKNLNTFNIHCGSVGKIMPLIFVKGKVSHVSNILTGLNPIPLLNELVNSLDLNKDFCFSDKGSLTSPPTVLGVKDLRQSYDVSIPEMSAAYFNMNFFKNVSIENILDKILELSKETVKNYLFKLKSVYKNFNDTSLEVPHIEVLSYREFKNIYLNKLNNINCILASIYKEIDSKVNSQQMNLQESSIYLITRLVKECNINHPIVIIGAIPPYYSAVNNDYIINNKYENNINISNYLSSTIDSIKEILSKYNLDLEIEPYFMGISDLSYTSCTEPLSEKQLLDNLIVSPNLYTIDFEKISKLNIPSINIGPFGKNLHENTERVYLKDVLQHIPEILNNII